MKTSNFDKKFDSGEDITESLDLTKARRLGLEARRVMVEALIKSNKEAKNALTDAEKALDKALGLLKKDKRKRVYPPPKSSS